MGIFLIVAMLVYQRVFWILQSQDLVPFNLGGFLIGMGIPQDPRHMGLQVLFLARGKTSLEVFAKKLPQQHWSMSEKRMYPQFWWIVIIPLKSWIRPPCSDTSKIIFLAVYPIIPAVLLVKSRLFLEKWINPVFLGYFLIFLENSWVDLYGGFLK